MCKTSLLQIVWRALAKARLNLLEVQDIRGHKGGTEPYKDSNFYMEMKI